MEENLTFLYEKQRSDCLILLLRYLSQNSEDDFWRYVEMFGLLQKEKTDILFINETRNICIDVCKRLIYSHRNTPLKHTLIESLYNDEYLKELIENFEIQDAPGKMKFVSFEGLSYMFCGPGYTYADAVSKGESFRQDVKYMIEGEISHDINEPVSEKIKNNFKLPFDLIEETLLANDRYAFEYILSYIEKLKISFTQNFRPVLENEIDTGFRVMMECGTSDYHFVFSYLKPIYFECIRIDFVSDEYKERLQKILSKENDLLLLTETNAERLKKFANDPIMYTI